MPNFQINNSKSIALFCLISSLHIFELRNENFESVQIVVLINNSGRINMSISIKNADNDPILTFTKALPNYHDFRFIYCFYYIIIIIFSLFLFLDKNCTQWIQVF